MSKIELSSPLICCFSHMACLSSLAPQFTQDPGRRPYLLLLVSSQSPSLPTSIPSSVSPLMLT